MNLKQRLTDLGLTRGAMLATVALLCVLGPLNDGVTRTSGIGLLVSVVAPATMVVLVFVLLLDITMTRIFASDCEGERKRQFLSASITETWALVALVLAWLPFMLRLLGVSLSAEGAG